VGASVGVSTRLLPMLLEVLSQRSPGLEVRLEAVRSADALLRLKCGAARTVCANAHLPSASP